MVFKNNRFFSKFIEAYFQPDHRFGVAIAGGFMIFLAYIVLPMTLVALFFAEICGRVYDRDDIPGFVFIIAVAMTISTIILSIFGVLLWWSYIIPATTVIFIVSLLTGAIMVPYYLYNGKNVPKS